MRTGALVVSLCLLIASCGEPDTTPTPDATSLGGATTTTTTTTTPPPTAAPPTTVPPTATPTTIDPGADALRVRVPVAPWGGPPLSAGQVPWVLAQEWQAAENRQTCSALFPADLVLDATADLRAADFADGWALAWDRANGPGRNPDGSYCADCGRSAYGVAGAGVVATGSEHERWPNVISFDDGSFAGYGYEGDADASSGAPLLMYLLVNGEGCLYNVWSFRGEDHLLGLVNQLRFVEGLRGDPTDWATPPDPSDVRAMGAPPWAAPALERADVDPIYFLEWEGEAGAPASCPLLVFADLGDEASGATMRRALNEGEMLVAWDRPSGPGHDGMSNPCADCGRGAVGLGTFQGSTFVRGQPSHRWDDGSEAWVGGGLYGIEARLRLSGFDCTYWLWSHLGEDHLDYLFTQLRRVAGAP